MMVDPITALVTFVAAKPTLSLLITSSLITALLVVVTRLLMNKKVVDEIKNRMEEIREQLTAAQKAGDTELANKHLADMMKTNSEYMRQTFKALIVSIVVVSIFLPFLKSGYEGMSAIKLPFSLPFLGSQITWIYWYILVSFAMGWVLRKILEVD
jgi:uncharacterized membrane protein (DUF106 family)